MRLAIVGGGISGLALAYYVTTRQHDASRFDQVCLFEASPRLGGVIDTRLWESYVLEMGPDSLVDKPGGAVELIREIGLGDHLIPMNPDAKPPLMRTTDGWKPFPSTETRSYSLDVGVHLLVERLGDRLKSVDIKLNRPVSRVMRASTGWYLDGDDTPYDAMVLALPASVIPLILEESGDPLSWCQHVQYQPRAVVGAVYRPDSFQALDLVQHTGFVVSPQVGLGLTAVTWLSSKWPYRRRSPYIVLRTFWGPPGENPGAWSDSELLRRHQQALEALAGLRGAPLWHTIQRLETALPQVDGRVTIEPIASDHGYLSFLGPYRIGPGVSDCVKAAAEEADRVLAWGQQRTLGRRR